MSIWTGLDLVDDADSNEPRLKGSGAAVWPLLNAYDAGASSEQIAGQFHLLLRDVQSVLSFAHRYLPETDPVDWSRCEAIERVPGRCGGAPVMRGTRMPVELVMDNLDSGVSVQEFAEDFEVDEGDVRTIRAFVEDLHRLPLAS